MLYALISLHRLQQGGHKSSSLNCRWCFQFNSINLTLTLCAADILFKWSPVSIQPHRPQDDPQCTSQRQTCHRQLSPNRNIHERGSCNAHLRSALSQSDKEWRLLPLQNDCTGKFLPLQNISSSYGFELPFHHCIVISSAEHFAQYFRTNLISAPSNYDRFML